MVPTSPLILMWTRAHLEIDKTPNDTTAKRSALSQQVATRLQGTDTTAQHTPTRTKNDPQKKITALDRSVKILLMEGLTFNTIIFQSILMIFSYFYENTFPFLTALAIFRMTFKSSSRVSGIKVSIIYLVQYGIPVIFILAIPMRCFFCGSFL